MLIGFFFFTVISFIILTLIDSECYIPQLDDPEWVYECGGDYYNTYYEVNTICLVKKPDARVFMIRRSAITIPSSTSTIPITTTTAVKSTTTRKPSTKKKGTTRRKGATKKKKTTKRRTTTKRKGTTKRKATTRKKKTTRRKGATKKSKTTKRRTSKKKKPTTTTITTSTPTTTNTITTTPTKQSSSEIDIKSLRRNYLIQTNMYRQLHGSPDLTNSEQLENLAQAYAEKLGEEYNGKLIHDPDKTYGENLAYVPISMIVDPVRLWYNEIQNYHYENPGFGMNTGHFTQLVWKNTKEMGCGIGKVNEKYPGYYIVSCKYNPSGNYEGQYKENVLPVQK
uniref:SCP domain-containing protein n=1 Tax=Strongyloides papillosus TaxID=174720 RepID=A0A0N5BQ79_STREA